jgi:hypothetical protein
MSSVKEAAVINQSVAHETIQTTPQGTKRPPYFPRVVGATTAWVTKPTVSTPTCDKVGSEEEEGRRTHRAEVADVAHAPGVGGGVRGRAIGTLHGGRALVDGLQSLAVQTGSRSERGNGGEGGTDLKGFISS